MSIDYVDEGRTEIIPMCHGTRPEGSRSGRSIIDIPLFIFHDPLIPSLIGCTSFNHEHGRCLLDSADMPLGARLIKDSPVCKFVGISRSLNTIAGNLPLYHG